MSETTDREPTPVDILALLSRIEAKLDGMLADLNAIKPRI